MRAFAAALLCPNGGCGECRACRLALGERHPNMVVLEPTGPDILVGKDAADPNTARGFARRAYLTPPEPGRKVMVVLQADRLRIEAADVLLKVLEEPPADTVFILMTARPDELPETVRSRCQEIAFPPLSEEFVVEALAREGVDPERALLACRLAGGNLGRARRMARDRAPAGVRATRRSPRRTGRRAGPTDALAAAEDLAGRGEGLPRRCWPRSWRRSSAPFLDERGQARGGVPRRGPADRGAARAPPAPGRARVPGRRAPGARRPTGGTWRCRPRRRRASTWSDQPGPDRGDRRRRG